MMQLKLVPIKNDIFLLKDSEMNDYFLKNKDDKIISFLQVDTEGRSIYNIPMIVITWTDVSYRNQGLLKFLVLEYVKNYGDLYSDQIHSLDAKNFWKSLLKSIPDKIVIRNLSNNKEMPYNKDIDMNHIWDGGSDIILGIRK